MVNLESSYHYNDNSIGYTVVIRGGSWILLGGGALVSCVYFNTNKPHSCRIPVVLENRRSSAGGGVRTPCTLPLDPPLVIITIIKVCIYSLIYLFVLLITITISFGEF